MRVLLAVVLSVVAVSANAGDVLCDGHGRYRECRVASSGIVTLSMDLSQNLCIEDVTWGQRETGVVWVSRGCRAVFHADELTGPMPGGGHVICESEHGRQVCPANTRSGVTLVRQLSARACVERVSWGVDYDKNQIWVDDGCRADFLLTYRGGEALAAPPKLDAVVNCSSTGRRTECKADTAEGVQLIRTLSDNACRFGHDWGYDSKQIWVANNCRADFAVRGAPRPTLQTVTCESESGARKNCDADTQFGVAIVREVGFDKCVLDRNWGFDGKGVWVSEGCRAQFALGGFRLAASAVPPTAKRVVCESKDGNPIKCEMNGVHGVGLVRQISESTCVLNRTWGWGPAGIWVSGGCRAEFAVLQ